MINPGITMLCLAFGYVLGLYLGDKYDCWRNSYAKKPFPIDSMGEVFRIVYYD